MTRNSQVRSSALLVLILVVVLTGPGCRVGEDGAGTGEATAAPEFTLDRLVGEPIALAELRGQVVVVDFWATWCGPCVFQIPVLNAFHDAHQGNGVVVLGISVDAGEREEVASFSAEQGIRYPVLLGDEGLAQRYGAIGFPSLYVIDPAGNVHASHVGVVSQDELEALVASARPR